MHHYQIIDTASAEKLGVLGFDPDNGFYVEQNTAKDSEDALNSMAESLNALENFHVSVQQGFSGTAAMVFKRDDAELPDYIPAIIMERFLMTAAKIAPENSLNQENP